MYIYIYIFGFTIHLYGGLIGPFCFLFCFLSTDLFLANFLLFANYYFLFLLNFLFFYFILSDFSCFLFNFLSFFHIYYFILLSISLVFLSILFFILFLGQKYFSLYFFYFILFNYCISEENKMACGQTRVSNRFMEAISPAGVYKESR